MSTTIFSKLAEGPAIHRAYARALSNRGYIVNPKSTVDLAADPDANTYLPHFGGSKISKRTAPQHIEEYGELHDAWNLDRDIEYLVSRLKGDIADLVTTVPLDGGRVRQTLDAAAIETQWNKLVEQEYRYSPESRPTNESAPYHVAYALLSALHGIPWQTNADGSAIERTLGNHPARIPASREPQRLTTKNDVLAETVAWAIIPKKHLDADSDQEDEIIMLSLVGRHRTLKAVWSEFMSNARRPLTLPYFSYGQSLEHRKARRLAGKARYKTFWEAPLPDSGLTHLLIEQAEVSAPKTGKPFAHIVGADGVPDLDRLFEQLEVALRLPLQRDWMAQIWEMATTSDSTTGRYRVITELPSHGCKAYWVRAQEDRTWAQIIAACAGATGDEAGVMETIGTVRSARVVIGGDDDDEEEEAE